MRKKNIAVLIVGCGNIAGGYNEKNKEIQDSITHISAYSSHGSFDIAACIESNPDRLKEFKKEWEIRDGFLSFNDFKKKKINIDVVSICTNTDSHINAIKEALLLRPKLIFCEKPLSDDIVEAKKIVEVCKTKHIKLAINYSRRWDPDCQDLKNNISKKKWGKLQSIVGTYNRGLLNNGSHIIDLLIYLFKNIS